VAWRHGQYEGQVKIGTGEIIFLLTILAIVFSASRMSALGNAIGKFVYSFKKAQKGEGFVDSKPVQRLNRTNETDAEIIEEKKRS
jgi:sec-independent protein translocase protein TatA